MSDEEGILDESPDMDDDEGEEVSTSGVKYHDRIRSEAEFAVSEIQQKDRYIGELHEKATRYKPLEQYVNAVGGDELVRLAGIGNRIESNPQLKQMLNDAINGVTSQPAPEEPEEEIYDPEIKALRNRYDPVVKQQAATIQELTNRLNKTEAIGLKGSLTTNTEKALAAFAEDPESLGEAAEEIKRAVANLESAAVAGDKSARYQMEQLGGPQGARTLRMMTIDIYDKYVAKKLGAASRSNGEVMRSKETDARATTRSALPTDTIAIKSGTKVTTQLMTEVLEAVTRKKGKDPDKLWH